MHCCMFCQLRLVMPHNDDSASGSCTWRSAKSRLCAHLTAGHSEPIHPHSLRLPVQHALGEEF